MEIIVAAFIVMQTLFVFWLFILTLNINKLKGNLTENNRVKKEMEQLFESYLMEMRMENEALIKKLQTSSIHQNRVTKNHDIQSSAKIQKPSSVSAQTSFDVDDGFAQIKSKDLINEPPRSNPIEQITYQKPAYAAIKPTTSKEAFVLNTEKKNDEIPSLTVGNAAVDEYVKKEEIYAQSLTAQVLLLKEQGFSLDEIARKLNKGKTELELLLRFRQ